MNITVLGSNGQIGSYLTEHLRSKGHKVTEIDKELGFHHDLRVTPNTFVEKAIKSADFVFFLAFDVGGSRYLKKYQHTKEWSHKIAHSKGGSDSADGGFWED